MITDIRQLSVYDQIEIFQIFWLFWLQWKCNSCVFTLLGVNYDQISNKTTKITLFKKFLLGGLSERVNSTVKLNSTVETKFP